MMRGLAGLAEPPSGLCGAGRHILPPNRCWECKRISSHSMNKEHKRVQKVITKINTFATKFQLQQFSIYIFSLNHGARAASCKVISCLMLPGEPGRGCGAWRCTACPRNGASCAISSSFLGTQSPHPPDRVPAKPPQPRASSGTPCWKHPATVVFQARPQAWDVAVSQQVWPRLAKRLPSALGRPQGTYTKVYVVNTIGRTDNKGQICFQLN